MKRRRNVLKQVKGYRFGRSKKEREAKVAIAHAGTHAFRSRRDKKSNFRRLWQIKINASARAQGVSYSKMAGNLKKANIGIDRKILTQLAEKYPEIFNRILEEIK